VDDPYAVDAEYYDLVHAGAPDDDLGLWLSFAGRTSRPTLEVGTGTGRIALALAAAGHRVTAIDPSPAMLQRAAAKAGSLGLAIDLRAGALPALALPEEDFGFVVVPADVFLYCRDSGEQLATLAGMRAAMHFNATLAIDLPGPAAWLDPALNGQPILAFAGPGADGEPFEVWHVRDDDLALQQRRLHVRYESVLADGTVRRRTSLHALRYVARYEMEHLLTLAGLPLADVYGDYDLGPLTTESERMIVVARRAGG
jgi:SAM-dependent methyltransferase